MPCRTLGFATAVQLAEEMEIVLTMHGTGLRREADEYNRREAQRLLRQRMLQEQDTAYRCVGPPPLRAHSAGHVEARVAAALCPCSQRVPGA